MLAYSVVIPARNAEQYLPEALRSVLVQTTPPAQIILVSDGSTDSTATIGSALGAHVIDWNSSRGPAAARNAGVAACATELVAFLDADDFWMPEHATGCLQSFEQPGVIFSSGRAIQFGDASGPVPMKFDASEPLDLRNALIVENPIIQSGVMIRRDAFMAVGGYDETLRWSEDYDLWQRLAERGLFAPLADATVRRRIHKSQVTSVHLHEMMKTGWFVRRRICVRRLEHASAAERAAVITLLCEAAQRDIDSAVWTGEQSALAVVRAELTQTDDELHLGGVLAAIGGTTDTMLRLAQDVRCRASRVRGTLRRRLASRPS